MTVAGAYEMSTSTYTYSQRRQYTSESSATTFAGIIGANGKEVETVDKASGTRAPEITTGNSGKVSYFAYANDGIVEYNGVVFTCDYEKNALCLGDCSNEDNCIKIPLSKGGSLMVNRNNLTDLGDAIGMFSPEDVNRILRAIAQDKQSQDKLNEIEENEDSVGEKTPLQQLREQIEQMQEKLKNGDVEQTFQIGAQSYTLKEWDKILEKFDKIRDALDEERKALEEKQKQEEMEKTSHLTNDREESFSKDFLAGNIDEDAFEKLFEDV